MQTPLQPFLPYPRFLLDLDLRQTAKMTYVLLLDRATLSQKNLWIDERGFVFVIFTICSLAEVKFQKEAWVWEKRRQQSLRGKIF